MSTSRRAAVGTALIVAAAALLLLIAVSPQKRPRRAAHDLSECASDGAPAPTHDSRRTAEVNAGATPVNAVGAHRRSGVDPAEREPTAEDAVTPAGLVTGRVSHDSLHLPSRSAESAMRDAIARLDVIDDRLVAFLEYCLDTDAADVPPGVGVLEHATDLAMVGARGVATEGDFYGDDFEALFPVAIEFATATDESDAAVSPADEFTPGTGRIFATFASESVVGTHVLVKWTDLDRRTVHVYGKYAVVPRAAHSYVWLDLHDDWPKGAYAVEIYSLKRDLAPIAGGRYRIR